MGEWLLSPKLKLPGMSKRQRVECSCQALRALQLDIGRGALGVIYPPKAATGVSPGFNPDRCIHIGRGIEWLRGDFQNVARWETGHRLEAYATLACRRGCRWSADLPAGAFETSF